MQFKWKIGATYEFKDVVGAYTLLGLDGSTNYKYTYAVFVSQEQNKRRRIKAQRAKELLKYEGNTEL
jgi:hypothetical protein